MWSSMRIVYTREVYVDERVMLTVGMSPYRPDRGGVASLFGSTGLVNERADSTTTSMMN